MNFCKKCGGKLENGSCPNCTINTTNAFCKKCGQKLENGTCTKCDMPIENIGFCKKCGNTLENGVCSSCTTKSTSTTSANSSTVVESSTNAFEPKAKVEKKPMSPKTKKIIIASCVGISLCAVAFVGFTIYQGKIQEKYAKEAISLVNDGKFEDANNILNKYKKDDNSILELKELNTLYLEVKKECEEGNFSRIQLLNEHVLKNSQGTPYINEVIKLKLTSEKLTALNDLKDIDTFISNGRIETAQDFMKTFEQYDLTEEEKAKVDEANAKITAALDKIKKEEAAKKEQEKKDNLKNTFLKRYNTLSNDYNDSFYSSMYSNFSEAEKSQMLQDIALTWDTLLNDVWKYLEKNMEPSKFETLKKDQIKWVEKKMKVEKEENIWGMSGNAFAQNKWSSLGQMNKERVKFLIDNYL